ncbi:TetR/AcrR family transcriptional regulator [Luteimonas sp. TWI1437]|uniref:TetR/AcrR family transcriptional regulator n=1 Tax=unclassified Luteimonas TaxID=2629088 RepID=UPI00320ACF9B
MPRQTRQAMMAQTRALLIASARQAFAQVGYAQTSMDAFTAKAGLTRGALYHHFGSKEGLLRAVVEQIEGEVALRLEAIGAAAGTPLEGFRRRCCAYLEFALEPEIRRIVLQDTRAVFGDVPAAAQSAAILTLETALQTLVDAGTVAPVAAPAAARMIYGAVTEAAFWIAESDDAQADRLAEALRTLHRVLDAILLPPPQGPIR